MKFQACLYTSALCAIGALAQPAGNSSPSWSPSKAASYLDSRIQWWMTWAPAQREQGTFCISCHTAAPYALGRPALHSALREDGPSPDERRLAENVAKRVVSWNNLAPLYKDSETLPGKSAESRGTESVLNALVLVWSNRDTPSLSPEAKKALDIMWSGQIASGGAKGAWPWLQFHNSPWEGDSQFYGAALAAIAIGNAAGDYRSSPDIQPKIAALREFIQREYASRKPIDRVMALWASTRIPGLVTPGQRDALIRTLAENQREDGGFSLSTLVGDWTRHDGTPLETKSDGYATAVVAFALQRAGIKSSDPIVERGLQWLRAHQQAQDGRWLAYSLNKQRDLNSDPGKFMSDAATAYSVMALEAAR
ncbi:MAG: hypothetical protein KGN84_11980 [Acidobacteriota bacterium]|nr:hypothetical protein [Acidobacteriota bacterium]